MLGSNGLASGRASQRQDVATTVSQAARMKHGEWEVTTIEDRRLRDDDDYKRDGIWFVLLLSLLWVLGNVYADQVE